MYCIHIQTLTTNSNQVNLVKSRQQQHTHTQQTDRIILHITVENNNKR